MLSASQELVVAKVDAFKHNRKPFFLSVNGGPGTGKSYLIRAITVAFADMNICVSALTGQAANLLDGATTVHRAFALGANPWPPRPSFAGFGAEYADVIIIDEVSMMSSSIMAAILDRLVDRWMDGSLPAIILVGDNCQLAPVVDRRSAESEMMAEEFGGIRWYAPKLQETIIKMYEFMGYITLDTNFRQQQDNEFIQCLQNIREKKNLVETARIFNAKCHKPCTDPKTLRLYSTNKAVDDFNNKSLMSLPGDLFTSKIIISGDLNKSDYSAVPEVVHIKVGARVMIVSNIYNDDASQMIAANGDMGTIENIVQGKNDLSVTVKLDRTEESVCISNTTNQVEKTVRAKKGGWEHTVVGTWRQLPLKLAYAMTIHKSQGQTLDKIHVDLGNWSPPGLAYVALSRARSMDNISIAKPLMGSSLSIGTDS